MAPEVGGENTRTARAVVAMLWATAAAAAAALSVWHLQSVGASGVGTDFGYFLAAARSALSGGSVYDVPGYVYSPLIAWVLAPVAAMPSAHVWWAVVSLAACLVAVVAMYIVLRPLARGWQRPLLALIMVLTVLGDAALSTELLLGQCDTIVLALVACALMLRRKDGSDGPLTGALLAAAAMVKTWPVLFAVWLFRRGAVRRWRAVGGYFAVILTVVMASVLVAGPGEIPAWISRTLTMSNQDFTVWSALGVGPALFTDTGHLVPLAIVPGLAVAITIVLAGCVIAIAVFVLRRPVDPALSLWHIVTASVLLLPVSHLQYFVLFVPLLWIWLAFAMRDRWRGPALIGVLVMATRWSTPWLLGPIDIDSRWKFLAIVLADLVALGLSAFLATRLAIIDADLVSATSESADQTKRLA